MNKGLITSGPRNVTITDHKPTYEEGKLYHKDTYIKEKKYN